jgi:GntR family transcriptional regulator
MTPETLTVDKGLPTPAYLQLKHQLASGIEDGTLRPGSALPSERELAESLGLSRMTVRRAFEELVADGHIEQRQGSGTYVRTQPLEQIIDRVIGFTDEARTLGFRPGARLLEAGVVPAGEEVAEALRVPPATPLLRITRLRTADEAPLAIQVAYLAPQLATLSLPELERIGSLYRTIDRHFGLRPHHAHQTIGARLPTRQESLLLEIARDVPVLGLERTTVSADGTRFEFVRSAYRGDRYRMALDLRAATR